MFNVGESFAMTSVSRADALRTEFEKAAKAAKTLRIRGDKLLEIDSVRHVFNIGSRDHRKYVAVTAVIVAVAAVVVHFDLHTSRGFTDFWFAWKHRNLYSEQCTIDMPNIVQDVFRPPVKCSVCAGIDSIDTVIDISPIEFRAKYAYSGRPVVVAGATANWTALTTFSFDFFRSLYADALDNFRHSCQFFPYQTEFRSLRDVFDMHNDRSRLESGSAPWYVGWSNCDSSVANVLRRHYERPYFLPPDAESSNTDWVFMGSPGYGAHMHIDHVGNPSWQAQISGTKQWTLVPPPECAHRCRPLRTVVNPGDIIVLDTNAWFHRTLIVGEELSITIGSEYD